MVETKLNKELILDGFFRAQTMFNKGNGCWLGSNAPDTKVIKTLGHNLAWITIIQDQISLHAINVYIDCLDKTK